MDQVRHHKFFTFSIARSAYTTEPAHTAKTTHTTHCIKHMFKFVWHIIMPATRYTKLTRLLVPTPPGFHRQLLYTASIQSQSNAPTQCRLAVTQPVPAAAYVDVYEVQVCCWLHRTTILQSRGCGATGRTNDVVPLLSLCPPTWSVTHTVAARLWWTDRGRPALHCPWDPRRSDASSGCGGHGRICSPI